MHRGTSPLVEPLTPREQEILSLVGQKRTNRQIAEELVLAHSTVRWYLRQIYGKLGVNGRQEAVARARFLGLLAIGASASANGNLPVAVTPFVGRQAELQALDELLLDTHVRLITIVGPGGIGKTRLALALASRQVARRVPGSDRLLFSDGTWYASLAALASPSQLVLAIAEAVGLELQPAGEGGRLPEKQVGDFLRDKRLLLVLDNFEHLAGASPVLASLLAVAPELKAVVTSRQRLQLRGEHLFWVHGLKVPEVESGDRAAASASVRLYAETARKVQAAFTLDETTLPAVVRTCRLLEGMPLGIELAAAWAGMLTPVQIEQEVASGLDILASELRDVPERHRSMQATLDISWQRLDAEEKEVFCKVAIFRGGFTREAAQAVGGATLATLASLVNKSWLTYDDAQDRYQVHELLRQFGEKHLGTETEVESAVRERHARYFLNYLKRRESAWHGPNQQQLLRALRQEAGNARLAWRWAAGEGEVALMAEGLDSLWTYYRRRGYEAEGRELLEEGRAALETLSVETDTGEARRLLARVLAWRSRFARSAGVGFDLLRQAEAVLEELRQQGFDVRRETVFCDLCLSQNRLIVDPLTARAPAERAHLLAQELGDETSAARAAEALAASAWHTGDYEEAEVRVQKALAAHRALDNLGGVANSLQVLGLIHKHHGRLAAAEEAHRQSYKLLQKLGDRSGAADMAGTLSATHCWLGQFTEARTVALEGLQSAERLGAAATTAYIASHAAFACIHLGRYEEALQHSTKAMTLGRNAGNLQTVGWAFTFQGQANLALGAQEQALGELEEAVTNLARFRKAIWMLPLAYQVFALLCLGESARAGEVLREVLRESLRIRVVHVGMSVLPAAAQFVSTQGDNQRALTLYRRARGYPHVARSRWFADVMNDTITGRMVPLIRENRERRPERDQEGELWEILAALHADLSESQ